MIYRCDKCEYKTDIKSNLNRHRVLKHSETSTRHACDFCDCDYGCLQSLRRHMVAKHADMTVAENTIPPALETIPVALETIPPSPKAIPSALEAISNDVVDQTKKYACEQCHREFVKKHTLKLHAKKCTGVSNPMECHLCHKVFTKSSNKARHMKICKQDAQTEPTTSAQTAATINNIENQININNVNNIDNSVTNNLTINFNGVSEQIQFLLDHINNEILRQAMMTQDEPNVLITYTKMLLEKFENQCVEKTNMRSEYSLVHVGDGNWELKSDCIVYPKLVADIASSASDYFHTNKKALSTNRRRFEDQQRMHDYVADNGYCADDRYAADVKRKYRKIMRETKAIAFNGRKKKK